MSKNSYELIIDDEIMNLIDHLADRKNEERSDFINRLLADYVLAHTPEMQIKEIYDLMTVQIETFAGFQITRLPARFMISIKSPLQYKYRPTIKYSVKLFPPGSSYLGELQVIFRTQHGELLRQITSFLELWIRMETYYMKQIAGADTIQYQLDDGYFRRTIMLPQTVDSSDSRVLSNAIGDYIKLFDDTLKFYLYDSNVSYQQIEKRYVEHLKNQFTVL